MAQQGNAPQGDNTSDFDFDYPQAAGNTTVVGDVAQSAVPATPTANAAPTAQALDFDFDYPGAIDTSKWDPQIAKYAPEIQAAGEAHGIPPQVIAAVMRTESNGNPTARSSTGALGLMQLDPGTAQDLGIKNPLDPKQNIEGGARYLAQMYEKFGN